MGSTVEMKLFVKLFLLSILVFFSTFSTAENFPKPVKLQPDVNFWVRVYTEIDRRSGFIHDSRDLSVVYSTVKLKGSPRSNKKNIKKVKAKYISILNALAKGKRTNLSKDEGQVLEMWGGENASRKRLVEAVKDIRFQRGQSDRFHSGLERSGEWRAYINQTFLDLNMPVELAVLPHVESSFNPKAYSHAGAAGLWQFIRATGKRYMQVDYLIDERMDPFSSTKAAAKLLGHNYQLTKSWPLALTAYNHGVASMRRAINKLGTRNVEVIVRNYKGRYFGFASRNFYVAFLAALEVDGNPEKYFGPINYAKPIEYETVKMNSYIFAKDIAHYLNVNKSELERHNRSLRKVIWSDTKRVPKNYTLRIPKVLMNKPAKQLMAEIPTEHRYQAQTADLFHRVVRGDTISDIAKQYGFRVSDVMAVNGMSGGNFIRAGQKLRLPVKNKTDAIVLAAKETSKTAVAKKSKSNPKLKANVVAGAEEKSAPAVAQVETAQVINEQHSVVKEATDNEQHSVVKEATDNELDVSIVAEADIDVVEEVSLLSDPADYTVNDDMTIEVQAEETLGHYADWLDLRASRLRDINSLRFGKPVSVGNRLLLDFSVVSIKEFENRRIVFQRNLQEKFFSQYRIGSTYQHTIGVGESLWMLALRKFKVPIWLLRQHNPDVNFNRIHVGVIIVVPTLIEAEHNLNVSE